MHFFTFSSMCSSVNDKWTTVVVVAVDRLRLHVFEASSCCQVEPDHCNQVTVRCLALVCSKLVINRKWHEELRPYMRKFIVVQFPPHQSWCLRMSLPSTFFFKHATPPDTTHFRRFIWTRYLRITKIETCVYTRAAPKVMPPIYFHGNYNRYKEHNNTIW